MYNDLEMNLPRPYRIHPGITEVHGWSATEADNVKMLCSAQSYIHEQVSASRSCPLELCAAYHWDICRKCMKDGWTQFIQLSNSNCFALIHQLVTLICHLPNYLMLLSTYVKQQAEDCFHSLFKNKNMHQLTYKLNTQILLTSCFITVFHPHSFSLSPRTPLG